VPVELLTRLAAGRRPGRLRARRYVLEGMRTADGSIQWVVFRRQRAG
jgi:hypothetical protein